MILEDDFYLAKDEKLLLQQAGAKIVGPFGSNFQSDQLSESGELDGAVVDINLGRGPSFDFARMLNEQGVPFIFVTGYDAAVIPSDLSHVQRIEKPFRSTEFVGAVVRLTRDEKPFDELAS
ncbi:hypothetical protein [uncultured Sphingomonas sp.]|uniref:hypothetical protein n=1 Tax=uncultured Sphingomonas sp. TaxID=158754 RepID=UPI0035C9AFE8